MTTIDTSQIQSLQTQLSTITSNTNEGLLQAINASTSADLQSALNNTKNLLISSLLSVQSSLISVKSNSSTQAQLQNIQAQLQQIQSSLQNTLQLPSTNSQEVSTVQSIVQSTLNALNDALSSVQTTIAQMIQSTSGTSLSQIFQSTISNIPLWACAIIFLALYFLVHAILNNTWITSAIVLISILYFGNIYLKK